MPGFAKCCCCPFAWGDIGLLAPVSAWSSELTFGASGYYQISIAIDAGQLNQKQDLNSNNTFQYCLPA